MSAPVAATQAAPPAVPGRCRPLSGTGIPTTFPHGLLRHAAERSDAPALREKEYGICRCMASWYS
ncbi:hypothetical protein D5047_02295 [Verminephrobacter eiseniae]|nr:hypothetical protein [Verminephrobacter eiseniae]